MREWGEAVDRVGVTNRQIQMGMSFLFYNFFIVVYSNQLFLTLIMRILKSSFVTCLMRQYPNKHRKKLEAVEMWFLRRMMKISWMAKKSNDTVLKEAHTSRALVNKIRTRQTTFFGHVMRREKLEHLITTGMMEGKRSRRKQREKMTDGLVKWLGAGKVVEILKATRDRGI